MPANIILEIKNENVTLGSTFRISAVASELVVGNNYRIQFIEKDLSSPQNIKDTVIETLAATPSSNKEIIVRSKEITPSSTGSKIYVARICSGKPDSLDKTSAALVVRVLDESLLTVIPPLGKTNGINVIVKAQKSKITPTGSVQFLVKKKSRCVRNS